MKKRVVFFFPWKKISGGPVYLSALADDLAAKGGYEVFYVDYKPGLSDTLIQNKEVIHISYPKPFDIPRDSPIILVTPIYTAMNIPKLPAGSQILFVNWHNYCIDALVASWRLSPKALQEFLELVHRTDSVFFLDRTHWLAQDQWIKGDYHFLERYVPVKGKIRAVRSLRNLVSEDEIHVGALGRLCRDKIYSIIDLIEQLENANCERKIHLHIIGDGEDASVVKDRLKTSRIPIHMEGTLTGDTLCRFLAEQVDVLFSMGMSVLEGATVGLPSVIMPHNVVPFHADEYVYLQDSRDGTVGWYNTQISQLSYPVRTMNEILRDVCTDGGKEKLGLAALEHLKRWHSSNIDLFEDALDATSLDIGRVEKFSRKQRKIRVLGIPVAKISTSFDGHEKSVSLLWIRNFMTYRTEAEERELFIMGKQVNWIKAEKDGGKYRLYLRVPFIKA